MIYLQLPTGNTLVVSSYEYYFVLKEEDIDNFFQACIADDLGVYKDNPFSDLGRGALNIEVNEDTEE